MIGAITAGLFSGAALAKPSSINYLVVAGGGGGGSDVGGGGGAGGLRSTVTATGGGGTLETAASVTGGSSYTVTVGAGGAGGALNQFGSDGNNSVFSSTGNDWEDLYRFVLPGFNLRPTELSGAIGVKQLEKLPEFIKKRRENADFFIDKFKYSQNYKIQIEVGNSSWFGFSIILQNKLIGKRREIIELLTINGVETRPVVTGNFTVNPVMKFLKFLPLPPLPAADLIHNEGFFIGNHHFDVSNEISHVYSILREYELENTK